jgi:subtilisin
MTLPAWSEQFTPERLPGFRSALPATISRDWALGDATGAGIRVAVIDSGVDGSHPAVGGLSGGVLLEYDPNAPSSARLIEGDHPDVVGHGTACAAIIRGLAPACELYSVRVLGSRLTGKGPVLAAGVRWAIDHGMHVVNMSLSSGKSDYFGLFHALADAAYFRNVMLVCAANNVPGPTYPSEYAAVFSVAAHAGEDPMHFDYNPHPPVEFGAPGIGVRVAWLGGSTITASGNSFAAPHIAGIMARILSKHPGLTAFEMKTVLAALADNSVAGGEGGPP